MSFLRSQLRGLRKSFILFNLSRELNFIRKVGAERKVILLGPPKSGSTIIAALLAEVAEQPVTLDVTRSIPDLGWRLTTWQGITKLDSFVFKYKKEFSRPVIKEPALTYFHPQLEKIFPKAQFVMIMRSPHHTIRSILDRLKIPGDLDVIDYDDWIELLKTPVWRLSMQGNWIGKPTNNYIEGLAQHWLMAAETYLSSPGDFRLIRYEDFVENKATEINRLAEDMGFSVKRDVSNKVDKQYQTKGNAEVDLHEFFGEKNYQIINNICGEAAAALGYGDN